MRAVFAALRYDYGIEKRGESLEIKAFYPALEANFEKISTFWLEEHGFPDDLNKLQKNLLHFVENENPEYIFFILMKYEIFPDTLLKLKENYKTINWFCDDGWRFESYTKIAAGYFTYCITVDKYSLQKYKENGYNDVILSQWASFDFADKIDFKRNSYKYDVSFIGGKNPTREWIVNFLGKRNIKVECFGAGWKNGRVSYEEIKEIYLRTKINLNLSNSVSNDIRFVNYLIFRSLIAFLTIPFTNPKKTLGNIKFYLSAFYAYFFSKKRVETIKARNFEISGSGGFQLSQFALEIEDYYTVGKEIALFSNIEDLERQISYYLHFQVDREEIRLNGYNRSKEHTYDLRIKQIMNTIFSLNGKNN